MSIEAMKQALEALERCGSESYSLERDAITSLRQAIAEAEIYAAAYPDNFVKEWAGLTLEDKQEYIKQDFGGNRLDAMDWAEKRLKEKNQ